MDLAGPLAPDHSGQMMQTEEDHLLVQEDHTGRVIMEAEMDMTQELISGQVSETATQPHLWWNL